MESESGKSVGLVQTPESAIPIKAEKEGWAEQSPEHWWKYVCEGIEKVKIQSGITEEEIEGIGIAYQMHGLVLLDVEGNTLREAIIWCDSRAVEIGERAFGEIGHVKCNSELLNSPGNFTASKLAWVKANEPHVYNRINKFMLPGDYIAYRLTQQMTTTVTGLSEGVLWDYQSNTLSETILAQYGISKELVPSVVPMFGLQGQVSALGASESGLKSGTPLLYRAGDQPNNALSLGVFEPGEVAATCGTSGVVYAVTNNFEIKESQRLNNFIHVNHSADRTRVGKLLCVNGAGIQYSWLKENLGLDNFQELNVLAEGIPEGSEGLTILPFGNGAERILYNRDIGSKVHHLNFNRHSKAHLARAALEGIAFAFVYGLEIMKNDGVIPRVIRVGNDNMFRSDVFAQTIATLADIQIEVYETTGATGAARACAFKDADMNLMEVFMREDHLRTIIPSKKNQELEGAYSQWRSVLQSALKENNL